MGQNRKSSMRAYDFRFTPESGLKSDIAPCPKSATNGSGEPSFDHFVGACQQSLGDRQAQSLRRLEINNQFIVSRRLHRQVSRLLALEDTVDIASCPSELVDPIR